ncbi:MAG TPA: T9SS type A sorting domain-containing protein [Chitinophagales bacterium]|nr:T9SS type A sorting domain-containing protein [Chitinophagales bacterium]
MNRIFTLCIALLLAVASQAQCTIDSTIQSWGFHPDTGTVLKHACLGSQYEEVIQIFAPESVTVQLGTFPVNYVQLDSMQGLPASLSYSTNPISGYMAGGERGCISIFGLADAPVGLYEFTIHYTANFTFLGVPQSLNFQAPYKIQIDSGVATFGEFSDTACSNNPYLFNGQWLSTAGDYTDTIANQAGCDSVITLHLTVQDMDTAITVSGDTITAAPGFQGYSLVDCNTNNIIANGSDNVFVFADTGSVYVTISTGECFANSRCVQFVNSEDTTVISAIKEYPSTVYFKLYPTVASQIVTVETAYPAGLLRIYNQTGQLVAQKPINRSKQIVDLTALSHGVYIAELHSGGQVQRLRFIKVEGN